MSPEINDLLDRGVPADVTEPDFHALAARGVRRRHTKRVGGIAIAAALVVGAGAVVGGALRDPAPIIGEQPGGDAAWRQVADGPLSARHDVMTFVDGDRVLVWGGRGRPDGQDTAVDANGTVHDGISFQDGAIYDAASDGWMVVPPHPLSPRWQPTVAFHGTVIAIYGGFEQEPVAEGGVHTGTNEQLTDGAVFDLEAERWTVLPPLPVDARRPAILDWNDDHELLLWGGDDGAGNAASDGAIWSEDTGWSPIADFPLAPRFGSFIALDDERLVVWGGGTQVDSTEEQLFADGAVYDREADAWTVLPTSPLEARWTSVPFPSGAPTSLLRDDRVLIVGGARTAPDVEQYLDGAWLDLDAVAWQPIPSAPADARFAESVTTGAYAVADGAGEHRVWTYDLGRAVWTEVGGITDAADVVVDAGAVTILAEDGANTTAASGRWRPVTVSRQGASTTPVLRDDRTVHFWAGVARTASGVLVWGGHEARLDADGSYRGDGQDTARGWFLPTR